MHQQTHNRKKLTEQKISKVNGIFQFDWDDRFSWASRPFHDERTLDSDRSTHKMIAHVELECLMVTHPLRPCLIDLIDAYGR